VIEVKRAGKTTLMKMAAGSVAFRKMEVWIKNMEVK